MASREKKIGSRYSKALFQALSDGSSDFRKESTSALQILAGLSSAVSASPETLAALENPMILEKKREELLTSIVAEAGGSVALVNFVKILFENGRFSSLSDVVSSFDRLVKDYFRQMDISVASARELDAEQKAQIENHFRSLLKNELIFNWKLDQELIGGIVVEYDGNRIDGSIKGRLAQIERAL